MFFVVMARGQPASQLLYLIINILRGHVSVASLEENVRPTFVRMYRESWPTRREGETHFDWKNTRKKIKPVAAVGQSDCCLGSL